MAGKDAGVPAGDTAAKKLPQTGKLQVMDIFKLGGGFILTGKVIEGAVRKGATGKLNGKPFTITKIESNRSAVEVASAGMLIGFSAEGPGSGNFASGTILEVKN